MTTLACPGCDRDLYETDAWPPVPGTVADAFDFKPLEGVPNPVPGTRMVCPFCGAGLVAVVKPDGRRGRPSHAVEPLFVVRV